MGPYMTGKPMNLTGVPESTMLFRYDRGCRRGNENDLKVKQVRDRSKDTPSDANPG